MGEGFVVNPYNFIPFGDGPARQPLAAYAAAPLRSGWFDVTLYIRTPLILPDGAKFDAHDVTLNNSLGTREARHKQYGFYRLPNGRPAIPGSSLRGLLRSVYEAATDSCLPFLPDDPQTPISQRTPLYAAFKNRGLLEFDPETRTWSLYSARVSRKKLKDAFEVRNGMYRGHKNGDPVNFTLDGDRQLLLDAGEEKGWLQFSIPVNLKQAYNVAVLQKNELLYREVEGKEGPGPFSMYKSLYSSLHDTVKHLEKAAENMQNYRNDSGIVRRVPQRDLKDRLEEIQKKGGCVPCYYFIVERDGKPMVYLSGAASGRVRQRRRWPEIMGEHGPCRSLDALCPACALFGTVQGDGTAGRVRVSDALSGKDCAEPADRTLPILAKPRCSAFEFYLRKPDPAATYWNFDFYGVRATRTWEKDGVTGTISYTDYRDLPEATPRGRKMYWHGEPKTTTDRSNQNATMEAMDRGSFTFRVSFDRITERQLRDLLWCVTLGDNRADSTLQHKLGHGKSVGYGSVKLVVDKLMFREVDPQNGFAVRTRKADLGAWLAAANRESDLRPEQVAAIRRMADTRSTKGMDVAYPTGWDNRGRETIYAWFAANRVNSADVLTLPEPKAEATLTLPSPRGKRPNRGNPPQRGGGKPPCSGSKAPYAGPRQQGAAPRQQYDRRGNAPGRVYRPGDVVNDATVSNTKGRNVFFRLPDTRTSGHYLAGWGDNFFPGDRVRVRIIRFNELFQTYEVEVLDR